MQSFNPVQIEKNIIDKFNDKFFNYHAACLPEERGAGNLSWKILQNNFNKNSIKIHKVEKDYDNVVFATEKFGIKYPVVQDNEKEIWGDFQNRYWPRKYIADHEGYIRFDHIGEGAYKETELIIQKLLQENNTKVNKNKLCEEISNE